MTKLKRFFINHGRKFLLAALFIFSGLLIAHFVSQYYYKQSLIDTVFKPQALVVAPAKVPEPTEPKGGSVPSPAAKPSPSPAPIDDDVKVEVFGLIKFELSEANSWQTIAKILTVILGTFFGIRAINSLFNKLDDDGEEPSDKPSKG